MDSNQTSAVTSILARVASGDAAAKEELIAVVYAELKQLAAGYMRQERAGHTWQPTALVHEAYARMFGERSPQFAGRSHFFATSARVMRRLLVDHARKRATGKRGAGLVVTLNESIDAAETVDKDVLLVDEVLEELAQLDPRAAKVVEMKFFGGMTEAEIGDALGMHEATVRRDWSFARAWLFNRLALNTRGNAAGA